MTIDNILQSYAVTEAPMENYSIELELARTDDVNVDVIPGMVHAESPDNKTSVKFICT